LGGLCINRGSILATWALTGTYPALIEEIILDEWFALLTGQSLLIFIQQI